MASITPTGGTTLGDTRVTITGTNLAGATAVTIGGVAAKSFTVVDANTIAAITPAHDAGAVDVVVWTPRGAATGRALYSYDSLVPAVVIGGAVVAGVAVGVAALAGGGTEPPPVYPHVPAVPTVTSVNPNAGPILGGSSATIRGTNLTGATTVKIGGVLTSSFTVVNATTITAIAPAHAPGTVDVAVTTPGGTGMGTALYTYTPPAPTVTSMSPTSGTTLGGTTVTITGTDLTGRDRGDIRRRAGIERHDRQRYHDHRDYAGACGRRRRCRGHHTGRHRHGGGALHLCDARPDGDVDEPDQRHDPGRHQRHHHRHQSDRCDGGDIRRRAGGERHRRQRHDHHRDYAGACGRHRRCCGHHPGRHSDGALHLCHAAPTVTAVNPTSGTTVGGTSVTITGTNLTGATAVTFGGVPATSVTVVNATTITATTPAHAAGAVDVAVTTPGGSGTGTALYTYVTPAPTVTSIGPTSGTTAGGTTVTITGTNLTGTTAVTFGGVPATSFTVVDANTIVAVVPAHAAGAVDVVITTPGGSATTTYTYVTPAPTLATVDPTSGTTAGGTTVTITGTNFTGTTAVTFGGVPAASFTVVNATTITAVTPAHAAGTFDIAVATPGGTATTAYTYVTPAPLVMSINPTSGPASGGTSVTIAGVNFLGTTSVMIGGVPATSFTIVNATTITAITPPRAAGAVDVVITTPGGSAPATVSYTYVPQTTTTSTVSSANPSTFGQAVTLTATVSGTGGPPTGTITFKNGAITLGSSALNGSGQATLTTSSLSVGSHSITATYSGSASFTASTSAAIIQVVGIPADSARLQALQTAVTKLVAQSSGQAMSGAIDSAIAEGFNDGGDLITPSDNGVRFNFPADSDRRSAVDERVGGSFAALGDPGSARNNVLKAPPPPPRIPREWFAWGEVRGTGWNTGVQAGDIRGGQTNALLGVTRKVTPDFLLGVFGGYEAFNYTSNTLNGRLKGEGWTIGGYLGWRILPGLRFDAGVARSGLAYDGVSGVASGTFPGQRWLASGGLTGTYKTMQGIEIEPSARVYALWEHEGAYADSLGIQHADRDFSTGRASVGVKVAYPWLWSAGTTVAPYAGIYGDYYFNSDNAVPLSAPSLLPSEYVQGGSARVISGLAVTFTGGPRVMFGGEYGGIGNDFKVWSLRGRAALPF